MSRTYYRVYLGCICILFFGHRIVHAQQLTPSMPLAWGGLGNEILMQAVCSPTGDYILAGSFGESITIGSLHLPSSSSIGSDLFVASTNSQGSENWILALHSVSGSSPSFHGLDVDSLGNTFIAGSSQSGIEVQSQLLTNAGFFIASVDVAGDLKWIQRLSDTAQFQPGDMTRASGSTLIFTGGFSGDWNYLGADYVGSTAFLGTDLFVARYSDELAPLNFIQIEVDNGGLSGEILETDDGSLIITASTSGTVNLGGLRLENENGLYFNYFIGKLSRDLEPIWGLSVGRHSVYRAHIAQRPDGKYYFAAVFEGQVSINNETYAELPEGELGTFLFLIDENGQVEWIERLQTIEHGISVRGLIAGPGGQAVIGTELNEDFIMDQVQVPVNNSLTQAIVVVSDSGDFEKLVQIVYPAQLLEVKDMFSCSDEVTTRVIGNFRNDLKGYNYTLVPQGAYDFFVSSLELDLVATDNGEFPSQIREKLYVYPNPNAKLFTVQYESRSTGFADVTVTNMLGEHVFSEEIKLSDLRQGLRIDSSMFVPAVYIVRVSVEEKILHKMMAVIR